MILRERRVINQIRLVWHLAFRVVSYSIYLNKDCRRKNSPFFLRLVDLPFPVSPPEESTIAIRTNFAKTKPSPSSDLVQKNQFISSAIVRMYDVSSSAQVRGNYALSLVSKEPNQLACNLAFSLSLHISTSRVCAVEEANRYRMCAQEPCLHFIACSLRQCLFFGQATRKSDPQRDSCDVVVLLGPTADTPPASVKLSWPLVAQTKRGYGTLP